MSRIDELIAELCPEGVEFKAIRELVRCEAGYTDLQRRNEAYWTDGTVPCVQYGQIYTRLRSILRRIHAAHFCTEAVKGLAEL